MSYLTFKILLASHISCLVAGVVAGKKMNEEEVTAYRHFIKQVDEEESAKFRRRMMISAAVASITLFASFTFVKLRFRKQLA